MPQVIERPHQLLIREHTSGMMRVVLVVLGLLPTILAPYELLIRPGWREISVIMIIPLLISLGAILVGGALIAAGILGVNQTLLVDGEVHALVQSTETAITPLRKQVYTAREVEHIRIVPRDWSDGPPTFTVQILLRNNRKIELSSFEKKSDAEYVAGRISVYCQIG